VGSVTPRSRFTPGERIHVSIGQEVWWASAGLGTEAKRINHLLLPGIERLVVQIVKLHSLYVSLHLMSFGDQVKENELSWSCSIHVRNENFIHRENLQVSCHLGDQAEMGG
jgi:hypothetical protein